MFKNQAEPCLNKNQVFKILAKHLDNNPKTSIPALRNAVYSILEKEGKIGAITERNGMMNYQYTRYISDEDALLVNECIYDLLFARVITPGINESNLDLPHVHLSDKNKLNEYL